MTKILELPAEPRNTVSGLDYVKTFSKRMLKTQLFMGTYEEKRFVQPLNAYRDVVRVHSDEKTFIENLLTVKHKAQSELGEFLPWIGITEPNMIGAPMGYCLWVILPVEVFGSYWFQVKSVRCSTMEVKVKLEVVRPVTCDPPQVTSPPLLAEPPTVVLQNVSQQITTNTSQFFAEILTLSNMKHSVIFLSLLLSTIVVSAVNLVKFLLEFLLKFLREFSGLVKAFTPITLTCLDLLRRTVYGTFSFVLALIYGGRPKPVSQQYNYSPYTPMIEYPDEVRLRRPNYRKKPHRSSVTIECLNDSS